MSRKIRLYRQAFAVTAVVGLVSGALFSSQTLAQACEPSLMDTLHAVELAVDSISIDSADPGASERENISWMRRELRLIRDACSRGRDVEAVWRLEQVQLRVATLVQSSSARPSCRVMGILHTNCPVAANPQDVKRKADIDPTARWLLVSTSP